MVKGGQSIFAQPKSPADVRKIFAKEKSLLTSSHRKYIKDIIEFLASWNSIPDFIRPVITCSNVYIGEWKFIQFISCRKSQCFIMFVSVSSTNFMIPKGLSSWPNIHIQLKKSHSRACSIVTPTSLPSFLISNSNMSRITSICCCTSLV